MVEPLAAVLVDVNGTLTDPAAIGAVWGRPELGERALSHAVHTAAVAVLLGGDGGRAFADHLRAGIEVVVAREGLDRRRVSEGSAVATALPARPGGLAALGALREAGLRVVALTNSGAEAGERTLMGCGLDGVVERVLGVDALSTFKPDPAVYEYAISQVGEAPDRIALLATHPWDLAGAAHAGMRTAWVRHEARRVWPAVFDAPDVVGDTLDETTARLVTFAGG